MFPETHKRGIAKFLNNKIDVPGLPECFEQPIFEQGVQLIDSTLESVLPMPVKAAIHSLEHGVEDLENLSDLGDNLTRQINKNLNIPFLDEESEGKFISAFVSLFLNCLRKNETVATFLSSNLEPVSEDAA
tara:strand:+ start:73 stop:465 length:393 start_codon:yes stop_codon:yes gene_type:complete